MNESDTSSDWTQEALGTRIAVTRQTIISIEKGTYSPSLELAFKLAREFGLRIEDMFKYEQANDAVKKAVLNRYVFNNTPQIILCPN